MFDYTLLHWTAFLTTAILLNLSPGPDMAYILAETVRGGRRSGFAAMGGIWTGAFVHVAMAALGLSAILATSAVAFSAVKWIGAAYLVWLGIEAFRSSGGSVLPKEENGPASACRPASLRRIYRRGVLVSALNPKVAIFFLAFLPQFVVADAGPEWAQLLLHGSLIIAVAGLIEPLLVLAGAGLAAALRRSERIGLWFDRTLGVLFIGLGIRLALTER